MATVDHDGAEFVLKANTPAVATSPQKPPRNTAFPVTEHLRKEAPAAPGALKARGTKKTPRAIAAHRQPKFSPESFVP